MTINEFYLNMRYLVTGGAGFIGSHIVEYLLAQEHQVCVLDNLSSGFRKNLDNFPNTKNLNFVKGNIRDFEIVKKCARNMDGILHCASRRDSQLLGQKIVPRVSSLDGHDISAFAKTRHIAL